jgi:hypothetical protein
MVILAMNMLQERSPMGSTRYPIVESLSDRSVTVARSRSAGGSDRTRRVGAVGEQLDHRAAIVSGSLPRFTHLSPPWLSYASV